MPRGIYNRSTAKKRSPRKRSQRDSETPALLSELVENYGKVGARQILRQVAKSKIALKIR